MIVRDSNLATALRMIQQSGALSVAPLRPLTDEAMRLNIRDGGWVTKNIISITATIVFCSSAANCELQRVASVLLHLLPAPRRFLRTQHVRGRGG